jgi:hypothetical protein
VEEVSKVPALPTCFLKPGASLIFGRRASQRLDVRQQAIRKKYLERLASTELDLTAETLGD